MYILGFKPVTAPLPVLMPRVLAGHNSCDKTFAYDCIANDLMHQGWCVVSGYFSAGLLSDLKLRIRHLDAEQSLTAAGIGRGDDNNQDRSIRRDKTRWLERKDITEIAFLDEMEILRCELNRRLMLGLFMFEAHFAQYNPDAFYKRHLDSFNGRKNRIISTVLYLNHGWKTEDGGMLALYKDEATHTPFASVMPENGTFVLFLSEEIPHEVQSTQRPRASIAGWFRCNDKFEAPALQVPSITSPTSF
jgi:SM-20-related protein